MTAWRACQRHSRRARARGGATPQAVASTFATDWLRHTGVTAAGWRAALAALSTDRLDGELTDADPQTVPADRITGPVTLTNHAASILWWRTSRPILARSPCLCSRPADAGRWTRSTGTGVTGAPGRPAGDVLAPDGRPGAAASPRAAGPAARSSRWPERSCCRCSAAAVWFSAYFFFGGFAGAGSNGADAANANLTACGQHADVTPDGTLPSVSSLDSEQVRDAAIIIKVGQDRKIPPRGWVIAIATALQESRLHNLPDLGARNDHDSIGLFQQRPSMGWGTPEQVADPVYATGKFYDKLVAVAGWQTRPLTRPRRTCSAAPIQTRTRSMKRSRPRSSTRWPTGRPGPRVTGRSAVHESWAR